MPFGNGTGPNGFGPMTGRTAGYCAGYDVPGYMNAAWGRGYWGRGLHRCGRRRRNWFYATGFTGWQRASLGYPMWGAFPYGAPVPNQLSGEHEIELLKTQASNLRDALANIQKRIDELEHQEQESHEKRKKE